MPLLALALATVVAAADDAPVKNPYLVRGIHQLEDFEEDKALQSLEKAKSWRDNTPHELAMVHFYLGLARAARLERELAVHDFREALRLEPRMTCSPHLSPRVKAWWTEAGGTEAPTPVEAPPAAAAPAPAAPAAPVSPSPAVSLTPAAAPPVAEPAVAPAAAGVEQKVDRGPPPRWPGWALCGAGVVAAGVGAAFGAQANATHARAGTEQDVGLVRQLNGTASTQASTANVFYVVSGAALVGGGVLVAFPLDLR